MRILLVEDNKALCKAIEAGLLHENYTVDICHTGDEGLFFALKPIYDLIILDRMLPVIDGLSILKALREKGITTNVIMATAMSEIDDRIDGLDSGADDYIVKPFATEELLARIRALSRRPKELQQAEILQVGDTILDLKTAELRCNGKTCSLTKKELDLMEVFLKRVNQTLSRELLMNAVWGYDTDVEMGNIDNYIHFLRKRLKTTGSRLKIKTLYSLGYKMEETT